MVTMRISNQAGVAEPSTIIGRQNNGDKWPILDICHAPTLCSHAAVDAADDAAVIADAAALYCIEHLTLKYMLRRI